MTPIVLTPSTGNGVATVFTAASLVSNEILFMDRLAQISGTDYTVTTVGGVSVYTMAIAPVPGALMNLVGVNALVGTAGSLTTSGFATALTIINRTAVQCGLASTTDPIGSTDPNFIQLVELLNMVGGDLLQEIDWTQFVTEGTISTAGSATSYALPADFDRFIDQTHWNRSTRFMMIGPLSGQEVQYLKAKLSGVLVQVAYRLQGNAITFPVAPSNSQTLAFEYISRNWIWSGSGPSKSAVTANADIILYDSDLAIAWLRHAFLEAKGFDTVAARERRDRTLESTIAKNIGAKTLELGGNSFNADHLIDSANLPTTGYN